MFAGPFDVRLSDMDEIDEESTTVVQPDIIICDKSGLKGTGYHGIPLILIEITSPASYKI